MSEELKPCPFCASDPREQDGTIAFVADQGEKWGRVYCCGCGGYGPEVRTSYKPAPDAEWCKTAVAEWNHRPLELAARVAGLREAQSMVEARMRAMRAVFAPEYVELALLVQKIRSRADALEGEAGGTAPRFTDATEQEGGV